MPNVSHGFLPSRMESESLALGNPRRIHGRIQAWRSQQRSLELWPQQTHCHWRPRLANLPNPIFICKSRGESFDREVWHCRECAHHWSMNDDECRNCHKGHRHGSAKAIKAGSVVTRREAAKAAGVGARTQATCSTIRSTKRTRFHDLERQSETD